ncbi:hypothetical protein ABVT39_025571 [Epinephelus coioides]
MSNSCPKQEAVRGSRKASQHPEQTTPVAEDANVTSALDATLLQSMMDSLKSDIFGKIDALSTSLRSEIFQSIFQNN